MTQIDVHTHIETRKATDALQATNLRGYDTPNGVTQAFACQRELEAIITSQPIIEPLAHDPKKLKASLTKMAADSRAHLDLLTAAEQARPAVAAQVIGATRAAVPGWLSKLQTDFATTWEDFRKVWLTAPISLDGYSTDEQAADHARLLRSVNQLDQILGVRAVLGTLLHEEGADPRNALLVADLPDIPQRTDAVEAMWVPLGTLISEWAGGGVQLTTGTHPPAAGIEKWDALASVQGLSVSLADVSQHEARTHKRDAWTEAITTVRSLGGAPVSPAHQWRELTG